MLGIGLDVASELDADHVVRTVQQALADDGAAAPHLACTTRVAGPVRRHVAVAIEWGSGVSVPFGLVADVLPTEGMRWVLVGPDGSVLRGDEELTGGARAAVTAVAARSAGRAVLFPGADELTGRRTVGEVLARSAIDEVRVLGGATVQPGDEVETRDHVRPSFSDGALVLTVQPATDGVFVPFESPNPTPCCAAHD